MPSSGGEQRPALAWGAIVLLAGLIFSALMSLHHMRLANETLSAAQWRQVEKGFHALEQQLALAELVVRAVQGLFLATQAVDEDELRRMHQSIQPRNAFSGLVAVGFAQRVSALGEPDRYETVMVAPREGNERLIGLDVASQPSDLVAVRRSRDTDQPVISAPLQLVQQGARGIVMRLPVFTPGPVPRDVEERRARFLGSIGVSFRAQELVGAAFEEGLAGAFRIRVVDEGTTLRPAGAVSDDQASAVGEPVVLYTSGAPDPALLGPAPFVHQIEFGERRWRLELWPLAAGGAATAGPLAGLVAMVVASVLLALLVWTLLANRQRALGLAERLSRQYRDSEERFRALADLLPALVLLIDADDMSAVYANRAARARLGTESLDYGGPLRVLAPDAPLGAPVRAVAAGGPPLANHRQQINGTGGEFWASVSATRIEVGGRLLVLLLVTDISELHELNEQLGYQASHDMLTDMFNRREFERQLERALSAAAGGDAHSALLYIDLDQFKLINDTCGHYAGDQQLAEVARMLKESVASGDVLARLGGDEFGVLLQRARAEEAVAVADRLRERIESFVFTWDQRNFNISASFGVVVIDRPGLSLREVLSHADRACYMAKERGRNRVHLYTEDDIDTARRHSEMEWVARVREALNEGRVSIDYQEIEQVKPSRQPRGAHIELLLRMRDEDGQSVDPGAFIPAVERFGLMPQVDRWVVETALANFDQLHPSGPDLELCAINLSGLTVEDDAFAAFVLELLERHRVPPHKLCFEITETAAVGNMARVVRFMERLRSVGCRFALDDFGAGAASFGYLKNLPIDILKIDGSFTRRIETDPVSYSIVRAVTDIGHQLGLEVVAEWVVSDRSRDLLRGVGVDYVQGYGVHRPEPTPLFRAETVSGG